MTVTTNNEFSSNRKLGLSPDSKHCIPSPEYWCGNLTRIAIATIVAGLALCTYL